MAAADDVRELGLCGRVKRQSHAKAQRREELEAEEMLAYRCGACGRLKIPDGMGCVHCGASWASLEVVEVAPEALMRELQGGGLCQGDSAVKDFRVRV